MALGDLTKQLAQQAIGGPVKDLLEARPAAPAAPEEPGAVILAQVQAMQKALKDDEELLVLLRHGPETIRVLEFIVPSWEVVVLSGVDAEKNVTRVVSAFESVQLVCKVRKVQPPARPARIAFVTPKPRGR